MSSGNISSDEFLRFQDQLISLKEDKYKLEDKYEYLQRLYNQLELKLIQTEKDLTKSNEFRSRFKSNKDIELLLLENDNLRERLSGNENNFKLQNDILKTECESLISENERLKSQLEVYSGSELHDFQQNSDEESRLRFLQMEITKLINEKNEISKLFDTTKIELNTYKQSNTDLSTKLDELQCEKDRLVTFVNDLQVEKDELNERNNVEHQKWEILVEEMKEKLSIDKTTELNELKIDLTNEFNSKILKLETDYQHKILELKEKIDSLNKTIDDNNSIHFDEIQQHLRDKESLEMLHEEILLNLKLELTDNLESVKSDYEEKLIEMKAENQKLEEELNFTKEELKVMTKKNNKMLRDMKRQLEKEVKNSQDSQSKLAETLLKNAGSSNLMMGINGSLSTLGDDQSSVYSLSNNGALSDSPNNIHMGNGSNLSSGNISVTDEELKLLIDRTAISQHECIELKQTIEMLEADKHQLQKTINQQQDIILNYIKNRGREGGTGTNSQSQTPNSNSPSHSQNYRSTSEMLTLNGILSNSNDASVTSNLAARLKDGFRSLGISMNQLGMNIGSSTTSGLSTSSNSSGNSSAPFNSYGITSSSKDQTKVTNQELRQLQRVCEELMMRCLNLESDLQLAVDLNCKLQQQLQQYKDAVGDIELDLSVPSSLPLATSQLLSAAPISTQSRHYHNTNS